MKDAWISASGRISHEVHRVRPGDLNLLRTTPPKLQAREHAAEAHRIF